MTMRSDARRAGIVAVAIVPLAAQQPAPGGQPPPTAGLVKKGKAPVSTEVLKVKLPRPREADLPNGLHLMVLEDHRLPRVTFQIIIPGAGGYYDPEAQIGLASYTAQMMREGHEDPIVAADLAGSGDARRRRDGRAAVPRASRPRWRGGVADRELPSSVRHRGGRPAQSVVPGRRMGPLKTRAKAGLQQQRRSRVSSRQRCSTGSCTATIRRVACPPRRNPSTPSRATRWCSSIRRTTFRITRRLRSPATSRSPMRASSSSRSSAAGRKAAPRSAR